MSRRDCEHEQWARRFCAPRRELGSPLVLGAPRDHCPWCAKAAGGKLVDGMMGKLISERDELVRRNGLHEERCRALVEQRDEAKRRGMREFEVTQETIGKLDEMREALMMAKEALRGVLTDPATKVDQDMPTESVVKASHAWAHVREAIAAVEGVLK